MRALRVSIYAFCASVSIVLPAVTQSLLTGGGTQIGAMPRLTTVYETIPSDIASFLFGSYPSGIVSSLVEGRQAIITMPTHTRAND